MEYPTTQDKMSLAMGNPLNTPLYINPKSDSPYSFFSGFQYTSKTSVK